VPPVTQSLLIANIAVYLLENYLGGRFIDMFALWPPSMPYFQPWQMVTYGFLHGGIGHIFFNTLALYMFGSDIERLFGSRFFLQFYFACLISAAITHLVVTGWMGAPPVPTIGASGAIFGILLAFGWYFPQRRVLLLILPIPLPARVFVALYGAFELYFGITQTMSGVAHFAHLGGMLGGWLMIQWRRQGFPFNRRR